MNQITRRFAAKQIGRLRGRMYDPQESQLDDLIDALMAGAESPEHATEAIDKLADDSIGECPTRADINRVLHETRRTERRPLAECSQCGGSGWRIMEKRGVSGAEKCDCWRRVPREKPAIRI